MFKGSIAGAEALHVRQRAAPTEHSGGNVCYQCCLLVVMYPVIIFYPKPRMRTWQLLGEVLLARGGSFSGLSLAGLAVTAQLTSIFHAATVFFLTRNCYASGAKPPPCKGRGLRGPVQGDSPRRFKNCFRCRAKRREGGRDGGGAPGAGAYGVASRAPSGEPDLARPLRVTLPTHYFNMV